MLRYIILCLLFASTFANNQNYMFLKGRVIDKETGEGLVGAIVAIKSTRIMSDTLGYCISKIYPWNACTIVVFHPHYETTYVKCTFAEGDTWFPNFMLKKKILLGEEFGIITGSVTEEKTHKPLIGADVIVVGTELGAPTGPNGRYVIYDVPRGSYALVCNYISYVAVEDSIVEVFPGETTIHDFVLSPMKIYVRVRIVPH